VKGFLFVGVARLADADLESGALQIQSLFCYRKKWSFLLFRSKEKTLFRFPTKKPFTIVKGFLFVGVARFELTTSCSQSRRDTGLRYTPNSGVNFKFVLGSNSY
jgi:hypothetical protein